MRSVVDLPQPDGPMSTAISPSGTSKAQVADRGRRLAGEDLADVLELDHASSADTGARSSRLARRAPARAGARTRRAVAAAPPKPITSVIDEAPPAVAVEVDRVVERPAARAEARRSRCSAAIRFMRYSQPSVGRRNTKNPALRWFVMNATVSVPMIAPAASGVSSPTTSAGARRELGDAREPGVQDAGLHAEAREPARGALDLAAPVDVVVAVGDHRRADRDAQDQQTEPDLVRAHVCATCDAPRRRLRRLQRRDATGRPSIPPRCR